MHPLLPLSSSPVFLFSVAASPKPPFPDINFILMIKRYSRFWLRRETKLHPSWVRLAYVSRLANVTVWNQSKFIGVKNVESNIEHFRSKWRKVSMGKHIVASCCCCCRTSYCIGFSFEGCLTQMFLPYCPNTDITEKARSWRETVWTWFRY